MLTVTVEFVGTTAIATVLNDGVPIDAQVQWQPGSPWRTAPGGIARLEYFDADDNALSSVRYTPPTQYLITARAMIELEYQYTDRLEVVIPTGAPSSGAAPVFDSGFSNIIVVDPQKQYRTIPEGLAAAAAIGAMVFVVPGVWSYNQDVQVPSGVNLVGAGTNCILEANLILGAGANAKGIMIADGYYIEQNGERYYA